MNIKIIKKIIGAVFCVMAFNACNNITIADNSASSRKPAEKAKVLINFSTEARTALPSIDWNSFTYELTAKEGDATASGKENVVFTGKTKAEMADGFLIDKGEYSFTLNAYKDGGKVLSGKTSADLTAGNAVLTFRMMAAEGGKGTAKITVYFPAVSPVVSVKAAVSSDINNVKNPTGETVKIEDDAGEKYITFSKSNLPSAKEQYVFLWFFDQTETLVYSGIETLVIVGGHTSQSNLKLTSEDWHTYATTISLKKDGEAWVSSGKTVSAVNKNDSSKVYTFKALEKGNYSASISEADYYIYVNGENTNVEFKSKEKKAELNYWTVNLTTENGCSLSTVSGGIDSTEKGAVVLNGNTYVYQVNLKPGYKVKDGKELDIKINDSSIADPAVNENLTINNVTSAQTIAVENLETQLFTIEYLDEEGNPISSWTDGYNAPSTYTVEEPAELPGILDVKKSGYKFDAWLDGSVTGKSVTETEGLAKNLVLYASWKDFVVVSKQENTVYANGYSLIIKANSSDTATEIWVDYDSDGVIDNGVDEQIIDTDNNNNKDFTNYALTAGNYDGKPINSDFTFTMTGGKLKSITGLDTATEKRKNKSTLNISGNAKIGGAENIGTVTDSETGIKTTTATKVYGIELETITDERVNIVGQMTGNYSVFCVTPYYYDAKNEHCVAYIEKSIYADLMRFTCYTYDEELDSGTGTSRCYIKSILGMKNFNLNGIKKARILMRDNSGVALPTADQVEGDVNVEFSLGDGRITQSCSVFSLSCEKGSFRVNARTTITENTSTEDKEIESNLAYMCQPSPTEYEYSLKFRTGGEGSAYQQYIYMQVLSSGNDLTAEMASNFLKQVYFKRDDPGVPMKIKVNLETVTTEEMNEAKVKYFNGSFYKYVPYSGTKSWSSCYNEAKSDANKFNGMRGYLMNVSSEVENSYIYSFYSGNAAWIGGSRNYPEGGVFDRSSYQLKSLTYNKSINVNSKDWKDDPDTGWIWYWQAGPEAGQPFWKGTNSTTTTAQVMDENGEYRYTKWNNANMNNGSSGAEPNNSNGETCIQYLTTTTGKAKGNWNDLADGSSTPKAYYIEYTPYDTYWDGSDAGDNACVASKPPITCKATY